MKKVTICDPPKGWMYGFPRAIPESIEKDLTGFDAWLIECGYPEELIKSYGTHFYCRFWEEEVEDEHPTRESI